MHSDDEELSPQDNLLQELKSIQSGIDDVSYYEANGQTNIIGQLMEFMVEAQNANTKAMLFWINAINDVAQRLLTAMGPQTVNVEVKGTEIRSFGQPTEICDATAAGIPGISLGPLTCRIAKHIPHTTHQDPGGAVWKEED